MQEPAVDSGASAASRSADASEDSSVLGDDEAPAKAPGGLPNAIASLGLRDFRYFWIGGLISGAGRFFQVVTLPVVIWELTESPGWVGFTGFAQFVPMAFMAPIAGPLADSYPRRKLLLLTQSLMALVAFAFAVMWWSGVRSPLAFVGLAVLSGLTAGLNLPAWQAFVSELVPKHLLLNAVTLNSAQFNASRLIGPVLAGITISQAGPGTAFAVNAASFLAVIVALCLIDAPGTPNVAVRAIRPMRNFVDVARYVRRNPGIDTAISVVALVGFVGLPIQVLMLVFAEDVFDRGGSGYSVMLTMVGAGAVASAPLVASLGSRVARSTIQSVALMAYSVAVAGVALAPTFYVSLGFLALMGAAHLASASTLNTAVQLQVDESRRAQVLAVYLMMLLLANPVGSLIGGQMIELFGPRRAFSCAAALMFSVGIVLRLGGRLRHLDIERGRYVPAVAPEVHPTTPAPPRHHRQAE